MSSGNPLLDRHRRRREPQPQSVRASRSSDIPPYEEGLSFAQLDAALKELRSGGGKAPGVDGISLDDLSQEEEHALLRQIRHRALNHNVKPAPVRKTRIRKAGRKSRELRLAVVAERVLLRGLHNAIASFLFSRLDRRMHAFREKCSVHTLLADAGKFVRAGFTYVAEVDIRTAFDSVDIDRALEDLGAMMRSDKPTEQDNRDKYLRLITTLLKGTERRPRMAGLPQGNSLSPIVFLCHLHQRLFTKLGEHPEAALLSYADNLVAIAKGPGAARAIIRETSQLLKEEGLRLKENNPVLTHLSAGQTITLFGISVRLEHGGLVYEIPETGWEGLGESLDECWNRENPNRATMDAVRSWLFHFRPCLREQTEATVQRARATSEERGFISFWDLTVQKAAGDAAQLWERERSALLTEDPNARVLRTLPAFSVENDLALPADPQAGRAFDNPSDDEVPF